jgi:molybdopterin synthase sulfur carrier subunit
MKVHAKYFASFRQKVGKKEEDLEGDFTTVHELVQYLKELYEIDTDILMVAVNRRVVPPEAELSESDEIAFFPPVCGG